jgi:hypothetical protein
VGRYRSVSRVRGFAEPANDEDVIPLKLAAA